jgi:hypothetical protein
MRLAFRFTDNSNETGSVIREGIDSDCSKEESVRKADSIGHW